MAKNTAKKSALSMFDVVEPVRQVKKETDSVPKKSAQNNTISPSVKKDDSINKTVTEKAHTSSEPENAKVSNDIKTSIPEQSSVFDYETPISDPIKSVTETETKENASGKKISAATSKKEKSTTTESVVETVKRKGKPKTRKPGDKKMSFWLEEDLAEALYKNLTYGQTAGEELNKLIREGMKKKKML